MTPHQQDMMQLVDRLRERLEGWAAESVKQAREIGDLKRWLADAEAERDFAVAGRITWQEHAERAQAERDALKAAIEDVKTCWPDPFGNWSAKEAHAARAVKEHMLRRLRAALDTPSGTDNQEADHG